MVSMMFSYDLPFLLQQPSLVVLLVLSILTILLFYYNHSHHHPAIATSTPPLLPPCPPFDLPLLGHLLLLPRFFTSSFAYQQLLLLGPIFSLRFGAIRMVFVTSASLTQEALLRKGSLFTSRYQSPSVAILNPNYRAIGVSNGIAWAMARRNLVQHTFAAKTIPAFGPARQRALDFMIHRLHRESGQAGGTIAAFKQFRIAIIHFTIAACFGYTVDEEEVLWEISETLEGISALFYPLFFADLYPLLRPLIVGSLRRKVATLITKQSNVLIPLILRHQEKKKSMVCDLIPGNYLESLLPQMVEDPSSKAAPPLTMSDVVTLCAEFMEASAASAATTLEWTMAHLVKDPAIQQKLYDHIYDAVGDRPVEECDLPKLPYLQAVVTETLRLHTPTPFLIPRQVMENCELGGYSIPSGTIVNFYVSAIAMDEEVWGDPTVYKPERMVGVEVDMTGTKKVMMLPFGAGRRMCPGAAFGRRNIEMMVARGVQEFEWKGSEGVELKEGFGMAVCMMAKRLKPHLCRRNGHRGQR